MWLPLFVDPRLADSLSEPAGSGPPVDPGAALLRWAERAGAVTVAGLGDAADVRPGDLVDFVGDAHGNPMVPVLDFVATSLAVLDDGRLGPDRRTAKGRPRPPETAGPDEAGATPEARHLVAALAAAARDDLRSAPVAEVVMFSGDLPVVVTVDRVLAGEAAEALLDTGRYRVIAKVAEVIGDGEGVSLLRRTLLAATGLDGGRDMLAELVEGGVDLAVTDPVVEGPALTVIPLAILL